MNYSNSIHQIAMDLGRKIIKRTENGEIQDLDLMAKDIAEDCRTSARAMLEATLKYLNESVREDKSERKQRGLVIKEKDRPREIYTELGRIRWSRDYYYDKQNAKYTALLDRILNIPEYGRIGNEVSAKLVNNAAEMSYAKAAKEVSDGEISRQTVRNHILKLQVPEKQPDEKRSPEVLHIYADEDHVHMQKPKKERGKRNQIVPLVTVSEGIEKVSERRNRTIRPMHFVDEEFNGKQLWESVEGYIAKAYDTEALKHIYVHGDGGKWIEKGLNAFKRTKHVIDGYHYQKELDRICKRFSKRNVRTVITTAITNDDKHKVDHFLHTLMEGAPEEDVAAAKRFGTYLLNQWVPIRNYVTLDIPGSCTEGQISHVLSERFSRNPMGWSRKGLAKLSKIRVLNLNGQKITAADFRGEQEETYREYGERMIQEYVKGCTDWSVFEREVPIYDTNAGMQRLLQAYGQNHGVLN